MLRRLDPFFLEHGKSLETDYPQLEGKAAEIAATERRIHALVIGRMVRLLKNELHSRILETTGRQTTRELGTALGTLSDRFNDLDNPAGGEALWLETVRNRSKRILAENPNRKMKRPRDPFEMMENMILRFF